LIGILASLLRLLPGGSAGRIRTLAKFVEKDYEKLAKIVKLRKQYAAQVQAVDRGIKEEQSTASAKVAEDVADQWLSRRLDAGLFCLQVGAFPDFIRSLLLTLTFLDY
jgi:beta-catenin-like protein 1